MSRWGETVEHWRAIPLLYVRPVKAINALLDHGSAAAAILLAVAALVLSWTQDAAQMSVYRQLFPQQAMQSAKPRAAAAEGDEELAEAPPGVTRQHRAVLEAFRFVVPTGFAPLGILLVVFIPTAVIIIAQWDGLGSNSVILRRDYVPMLATVLTAWGAAYLPAAFVRWSVGTLVAPVVSALIPIAAHLYFLALTVVAVRVIMGASAGRAAVSVVGAWTASVAVLMASGVWAPLLYYLTSPWVLYMLYRGTQWDMSALTRGLSGRQALKRSLEAAAINPRDADAHYQLGLIYAQRRNLGEAESRFRTAIAIDTQAGDAYLELGRIEAVRGRYGEALKHFQIGAGIDDKLASSEVWREIGAAMLKLGDTAGALSALEKYTDRRPYDPEGLVHYGQALKQANRGGEARSMFERAIEAVKTMPSHRRGQLKRWARGAHDGLKSLG